MIERRRTVTVAVAAALVTSGAIGTVRADLPAGVRQSSTAETAGAEIAKYVKGQLDLVVANDKKSAAAREELCKQTEPTQSITPSGSFDTTYVNAVVTGLQPILAGKDVVQRLNAAIVLQRLAVSTHLAQLVPAIQQVIGDESPAVALKGVQAAAALMPWILNNPMNLKNQKLTGAVLDSVKKHPTAGPLVQDAYNALYLPEPPLPPSAYGPCIDATNGLMAMRVEQYQTALPAYPQADRIAVGFFTRQIVRDAMTPAQRTQTMQSLMNLLAASARRVGPAPQAERKELAKVPQACASLISILLQAQPAAARPFQDIGRLLDGTHDDEVEKKLGEALQALQALPEYKGLKAAVPAG